MKEKMICQYFKDALRKKLVGVHFDMFATNDEEISYEYIEKHYLKYM